MRQQKIKGNVKHTAIQLAGRKENKSAVIFFLPAHPESCTHSFSFETHILNLSESQDSQSYSGKFCNGRNDFLEGLILYSPSETWDT